MTAKAARHNSRISLAYLDSLPDDRLMLCMDGAQSAEHVRAEIARHAAAGLIYWPDGREGNIDQRIA